MHVEVSLDVYIQIRINAITRAQPALCRDKVRLESVLRCTDWSVYETKKAESRILFHTAMADRAVSVYGIAHGGRRIYQYDRLGHRG